MIYLLTSVGLPAGLVVAVILMVFPRVSGRVESGVEIQVQLLPILLSDEVPKEEIISCGSEPEDFDPELVDTEVEWEEDWVGLFDDYSSVDFVTGIASYEPVLYRMKSIVGCGPGRPTRSPRRLAIGKGLAWLVRNQGSSCSWGGNEVGTTGLALVALMWHGNSMRQGEYANSVVSGINWLQRIQNSKTGAFGDELQPRHLERHAMANSAMALAKLTSGSILLRKKATASTAYLKRKTEANLRTLNPSAALWVFHSLNESQMCGLDSGLSAKTIAEGLSVDLSEALDLNFGSLDLQALFFETLALKKVGGAQWEDWKHRVEKKLLGLQSLAADDHRGSWDSVGVWGADGDRAYSTALCLLILGLL